MRYSPSERKARKVEARRLLDRLYELQDECHAKHLALAKAGQDETTGLKDIRATYRETHRQWLLVREPPPTGDDN